MQWVVEAEDITQGSIVSGVDWGRGNENPPLSIVLSNACDFENDKLGFVIVAALVPAKETLEMTKEYRDKVSSAGTGQELARKPWESFSNYLVSFIHNTKVGRYYFFDPTPTIDAPLLLVDFQQIRSLDLAMLEGLGIEGQLAHPHVEKMMAHFVSYVGRVPTERVEPLQEALYLEKLRGEYHRRV